MVFTPAVGQDRTAAPLDARAAFVYRSLPIRGICVLAVIAIHVTGIAVLGHPAAPLAAALLLLNSLARFAVPLFVVLSGFHLSLNPRNERGRILYRRALKPLLVAYVVYSTVYVVATQPLDASFARVWLQRTLTGTAYGHLWFIPVILELYLLHPPLRRWYRARTHPGRVVLGAMVVQVCAGLAGLPERTPASGGALRGALVAAAFLPHIGNFLAGYFLHDNAQRVAGWVRIRGVKGGAASAWLGLAAVVTMVALTGGEVRVLSPRSLKDAVSTAFGPLLAGSAFVLLAGWNPGAMRRFGGAVDRLAHVSGLYAYGIYYIHPLVLVAVSFVVTEFTTLSWNDAAFYPIAFCSVPVLSIVLIKALVRLPFTRYLA